MRVLYFILLVLIISSCADSMKISDEKADKNISDIQIRTAKVEINEDGYEDVIVEKPKPDFDIISPKDSQSINGSDIMVELELLNLSLSREAKNDWSFAVWLDSEKTITGETKISFHDVSSGRHSITIELLDSGHASFNPKIMKTIIVNVQPIVIDAQITKTGGLREYFVEADDYGFYPKLMHAEIGDNIIINFKFRDHLIYFAGMDVKGPFEDIKYRKGDKQPIQRNFTMSGKMSITSYWPSSGVKKGTLAVEIEN